MAINGVNDGGKKYEKTTYGKLQKLRNEKNKATSKAFKHQQPTQESSPTDENMKKTTYTYDKIQDLRKKKDEATQEILKNVKNNTYERLDGESTGKKPPLGL